MFSNEQAAEDVHEPAYSWGDGLLDHASKWREACVKAKKPAGYQCDIGGVVEQQDLGERAGDVVGCAVAAVELGVEEEAVHFRVELGCG